jgi:ABC-type uncharacterized transport system ATPase subunit
MMNEVVLAFEEVWLPPGDTFADLTFALSAGDLALVDAGGAPNLSPLADAAAGLLAPGRGHVTFLGEDWQEAGPSRAADLRGRIGRVFERPAWISNLDVDENVTLAQRHHTRRRRQQITDEADALAQELGLDAVPRQRPALVEPADLRAAEWVRALLGTPRLVILERPLRGVPLERLDDLLRVVRAARQRGAAVLWLARRSAERDRVARDATARYAYRESTVIAQEEAAPWPNHSSSDT